MVKGIMIAARSPRIVALIISIVMAFFACKQNAKTAETESETSPALSPQESLARMQLEPGFEIKLVAAEPLISTPVAINFDEKGRIWVLEMTGYMPDTLGSGEDQPSGKVVILEDSNSDGVADRRKVFLDSLKLPRALCLIENGLLVAEPPFLWYYQIDKDQPVSKTLVDDQYADKGNVEHQPNGLLRALDNWIYSAKCDKRYRKEGDRWITERTHFRGQWGISQDDAGRLFYNDNSTNLLGDYFSPGLGASNKNQQKVAGFLEKIVPDNRVYPIHATAGVNRGYVKGVLDDSLRLVNFTAACGPVIYRGAAFGPEYDQNAFVAEPAANLVKRDILSREGYAVSGVQAYKQREFLASTDERFRPVNLLNGPDGALYVVDMYRGIIQHKTYLTTYLKEQIQKRELTGPVSCGRIYKIVPSGKQRSPVTMPGDPLQLVALLGDANGWVRDKAQQMLVDRKGKDAVPALKAALQEKGNPLKTIHALWTLEGLHALEEKEVLAALQDTSASIRLQALSVIPSVINRQSAPAYIAVLKQMVQQQDTLALPYIGFIAGAIRRQDAAAADKLLASIVQSYGRNRYIADAVISNWEGREEGMQSTVASAIPDTSYAIRKRLQQVVAGIRDIRKNNDQAALKKAYPEGAAIFSSTCQTCHGADGNGIASLAPPLNRSQWINGKKDQLISIVLFGLTGPVEVDGHLYKAPEITADMPGIGNTKEFSDEDVAQLLSYVRSCWQNNAGKVSAQEVTSVRTRLRGREKPFTMEELKKQ